VRVSRGHHGSMYRQLPYCLHMSPSGFFLFGHVIRNSDTYVLGPEQCEQYPPAAGAVGSAL
jgi:hypothetical protein